MTSAEICAVIPAGQGRESNLELMLAQLDHLEHASGRVLVVLDGWNPHNSMPVCAENVVFVAAAKHEPGMEQPRNYGVRWARHHWPEVTHVHFLDSDVILDPAAPSAIECALQDDVEDAILIAPYDWLGPGWRPLTAGDVGFIDGARRTQNDPRWPMFRNSNPEQVFRGDLSVGLGCFSGNLVWPIDEFIRVGGFWNQLYHGRAEDGELGLRAVAMDVPIRVLSEPRGYHLHHPVDTSLIYERNARDVPMINERHPWVQAGKLVLVDREGAAFDTTCPKCGAQIPTGNAWEHVDACA